LVDWISAAKVGPETLFASGLSSKATAGGSTGTTVGGVSTKSAQSVATFAAKTLF
jgi:hypothetical protein